jgi:S-DNA-T family DNA segregation ATPase FtsK/SpoIIIE
VRDTLGEVALGDAAMRLARVLRDGPALGVVAIITTDGSSSSALAVARSVTWVFHVIDPATARTAGLRAAPVDPGVPGRLRVVSSGLEGQIVLDPDPLGPMPTPAPTCDVDGSRRVGPAPIEVLAEVIDPDELDRRDATAARPAPAGDHPTELLIGLGADDLAPAVLRVPVGDHVFIGGAARTGRSTALRQVEAAWRRVHPEGVVVRVDRHHPPADVFGERAVLIVVDDAERVDDPDGRLVRIAGNVGVTFAVAARIEAVRVAYGHWTREIARSRCGLIMTSMGDIDGELLGATLPRRPSIPPRPGLAWVIDQDGHRLVQVAARMPP